MEAGPENARWQAREQQNEEQRKKRALLATAIRKPPVIVGLEDVAGYNR